MAGSGPKRTEGMMEQNGGDPRQMRRVAVGSLPLEVEVMIYGQTLGDLKPLLILNSIELPMPPSKAFCDQLWEAGYQVIFCRRPGFGRTRGLPSPLLTDLEIRNSAATAAETAVFSTLIETLGLQDIVLMGLGTSNSVCLRLAQLSPEIRFCVFANPLFHPTIWDVIRPPWLMRMIRQTVSSRAGLKIAVKGLRAVLRRDTLWFYRQFAQKSAGDQAYIDANTLDFKHAGLYLQKLKPETYFYDLKTSLIDDTKWDAERCKKISGTVLCGRETTTTFKTAIEAEASRLGFPIVFASSGDLFVPYVSVDELIQILAAREPARTHSV
ncbi:MAG: hypothetical protein AAGJ84_14820 [Pseudomonadota bacterium]